MPPFGLVAVTAVNRQVAVYLSRARVGERKYSPTGTPSATLIRRIQKTDEGKNFVRRPFKILRKTGGDLIRRHSDGEVAAVFHSRGQAVSIDDLADAYTTRPFGKVFRAIRSVEEYLKRMFDSAGENPFGD